MAEQWKDIPSFSNYQASNLGRIRNKTTKRINYGSPNWKKYFRVKIGEKSYYTHVLVARAWILNDGPEHKTTVDHINSVNDDNRVVNLRWATKREQCLNRQMTNNYGLKRRVDQLDIYSKDVLKTFPSLSAAARSIGPKASSSSIMKVCKRIQGTAYGFKWRYTPPRHCPGELWKPISGHPTFQVSSRGRVMTPDKIINDHFYQPKCSEYPVITIEGVAHRRHNLLGDAFIGKVDDTLVYNHKNGDKWNCTLENLEVCTQSENIIHTY